eukprot:maker-scaffold29_size597861-snap-gene-3.10 protein:Tk04648 transcript:maker-scaffold29_size597861-snap-gene-3.10-mRNA-1 annotation:"cd63 antigen"
MDNCCDSMLKYIIFIFNFFLFMTGVALIAMGTYVHIEMSNYLNFLDDSYLNSQIVFIVVGVTILIVGFFGCCGACTESYCMMYTFGTLLAVVIITEVGLAVAVYIFKGDAQGIITTKMVNGLENYSADPESQFAGVSETWNIIQTDFQCCGVTVYTDWKNATFSQQSNVPDSCCKLNTENCGRGILDGTGDVSTINQAGCLKLLESFVEDNITSVGGAAIGIVILQILGVLVACMLAGNMKRRDNYV